MLVSNCCGARFYEPDYPDNDICSACGEHSGPIEQKMEEEWREKIRFIKKKKKETQDEFDDEDTWKEQEEYLDYKERRSGK